MRFAWLITTIVLLDCLPSVAAEQASFVSAVEAAQSKVVKIFGAGGIAGLEGYQSGFLVDGRGHVVTAWSYVLGEDSVTVVLSDGRRFEGRLAGADPRSEVAVLALDYEGDELPHFRWKEAHPATPGTRVLALSNIFRIAMGDEPVSVQHGMISGVLPLAARYGATRVRFRGDVYIVDAITSNPGAAGGAVVDRHGNLLAMIGKELRGAESNTWLNYAIPVAAFSSSVDDILAGKFVAPDLAEDRALSKNPMKASLLGIVLVPDVVAKTPPYVDAVYPNSAAANAGIRPDDLIVYIENRLMPSCSEVHATLSEIDRDMQVRLTVVRDGELIENVLEVEEE